MIVEPPKWVKKYDDISYHISNFSKDEIYAIIIEASNDAAEIAYKKTYDYLVNLTNEGDFENKKTNYGETKNKFNDKKFNYENFKYDEDKALSFLYLNFKDEIFTSFEIVKLIEKGNSEDYYWFVKTAFKESDEILTGHSSYKFLRKNQNKEFINSYGLTLILKNNEADYWRFQQC